MRRLILPAVLMTVVLSADPLRAQPYAVVPSGWLRVRVIPSDARVLVDGFPAKVDATSGESDRVGLLVGPHALEVTREGFAPHRSEVMIQQGRLENLEVRLRPARARVLGAAPPPRRAPAEPAPKPIAPLEVATARAPAAAQSPALSGAGIEILEPRPGMEGTPEDEARGAVRVRGRAHDPFGVFAVFVDQRPAALRSVGDGTVEFWLDDVRPRDGRRVVLVTATNTVGTEQHLTLSMGGQTKRGTDGVRDRWALVVGISEYGPAANGVEGLRFARRDAKAMYRFLRRPEGGGFARDHILLLVDEDATSANLRGGVRDFLGRAGEDDLVVLFFAGHGTPDPARPDVLYLLTHDSDLERLGATAFDMDEIKMALAKNISARRVVGFVDACHSGGVSIGGSRAGSERLTAVNRYLLELGRSRPGVVLMTASQANEPSWEDASWGGGHGVFTHFILEGMRGAADRDVDALVSVQELIDFVGDRVRRETGYKQHPTVSTSAPWDPTMPLAIVARR